MRVFVDSSAWFALADVADAHHGRARVRLSEPNERITSDHVLIETWRLIRHQFSDSVAEQFWGGLRDGIATIVQTTDADLEAAWAIAERFPDQSFSLVDRTSFALMERLGVTRVIAFDADFSIYRYGRRRSRAFEVLR